MYFISSHHAHRNHSSITLYYYNHNLQILILIEHVQLIAKQQLALVYNLNEYFKEKFV